MIKYRTSSRRGDSAIVAGVRYCQLRDTEVDPQAEETKGGSKHVAKCVLSASDKQLAICCYVPKSKTDKLLATDWLQEVSPS